MPTRFRLPSDVQRVGSKCPPYLTKGTRANHQAA